jgi:hypothetical protein
VTAAPAPLRRTLARRLVDWAVGFEDGEILRAAFFGMLAATVCVVGIDYVELSARDAALAPAQASLPQPILPAFDPQAPEGKPGPAVTTDQKLLEQPLAMALGPGGVETLTGSIDPGAAQRFATEVAAHGEYVKTIVLDSPGGSVSDALAIGRQIRDKGFSTSVPAGALCASSCPLVLAGGKKRSADVKAAIGVHQIYETTASAAPPRLAEVRQLAAGAMAAAQRSTALIERYLDEMGIDDGVWLLALETPPDRLYYFSPEELVALKLVTNLNQQLRRGGTDSP